MNNQEKQNALLKDIKKVLNDHGAQIESDFDVTRGHSMAIYFNDDTNSFSFSLGSLIDGSPVKDPEWHKERIEYLESELIAKDSQIGVLSRVNERLGKENYDLIR